MLEAEDAGASYSGGYNDSASLAAQPRTGSTHSTFEQRSDCIPSVVSVRPKLNCGIGIYPRRAILARSVSMLGHVSINPDLQKQVFQHVLQRCAEVGEKVVTVHSVRSLAAVLDHVEVFLPSSRG